MSSLSPDRGSNALEYRLTMLEPVLQGYAEQDSTRIIILPPSVNKPTENGTSANGAHTTSLDDEDDDLEIDEGFLANSLNSHMPNGEQINTVPSTSHDNLHPPSSSSSSPGHEFAAHPLPFDYVAPSAEEFTVFIRTSDLPRVGIQDGDWVRYIFWELSQAHASLAIFQALARSRYSIKSRLVRVKAHDEMAKIPWVSYILPPPDFEPYPHLSGHAYAPLILLRNIFPEVSIAESKLHLQACPGGSPPSIPTAKTVTVARVASRVSTNRIYQNMLLHSLKDYFDHSKRLISQGDLLSVPVDIGAMLDATDEEAGEVLVKE